MAGDSGLLNGMGWQECVSGGIIVVGFMAAEFERLVMFYAVNLVLVVVFVLRDNKCCRM